MALTAKILVEVDNVDTDIVKELTVVLHGMLLDSYEIIKSISPIDTCLKILDGKETDEKYENFRSKIEKAYQGLGRLLFKNGEKEQSDKLSKRILNGFYSLLSFIEREFGAQKFDIKWVESIAIIVKFASKKEYEKAFNKNRKLLVENVAKCFDIIFKNMDRCKEQEKQASHHKCRVTIERL